jgi:hypothetical protein
MNQENLTYAKHIEKNYKDGKFDEYISAILTPPQYGLEFNCLIFAFQPPYDWKAGNEAYPVALNLDQKQFQYECKTIYTIYKEKSIKLKNSKGVNNE